MYATWYVLEDGAVADPAEVAPDHAGVLRHTSGIAVAVGPYGPRSRGVNLAEVAAKKEAAKVLPRRDRQMKPAIPGVKYETR